MVDRNAVRWVFCLGAFVLALGARPVTAEAKPFGTFVRDVRAVKQARTDGRFDQYYKEAKAVLTVKAGRFPFYNAVLGGGAGALLASLPVMMMNRVSGIVCAVNALGMIGYGVGKNLQLAHRARVIAAKRILNYDANFNWGTLVREAQSAVR